MMRRVAAETRTEIKRLQARATGLRTSIAKLKAEPDPDVAKIKMLHATLATVEQQIETTRQRCGTSKIIRENC